MRITDKIRIGILLSCIIFSQISVAQNYNAKIDSLLNAYSVLNKFNGTALVFQKGKILYKKSYGYSDKNNNQLVSSKNIFHIGSLTKTFTAILVLKLAEQKLIALDDPIYKFLPDFPNGNRITIRHLLTHTSGVYEPFRNPVFIENLSSLKKYSNTEKVNYFINEPLDFEPGSKFSYSNSGYVLLGVIIEKITGKSYEECLNYYLFSSLKMSNTGFGYSHVKKYRTVGYGYLSKTKQIEAPIWNPDLLFSAGALYSNTADLLSFYKGVKSFSIISRANLAEATTQYLGGYGLGFYIDSIGTDAVVNHGGNIEGFTSYFAMNTERDICIILLNNITSASLERIGNSIYKIVTNQRYSLPKPKQEIKISNDLLMSYAGKYEISSNNVVNILYENNKLFLQENDGNKFELMAEKENSFFIKGEDIEIEFITVKGNVSSVKIKQGLLRKVGDKTK